MNNTRRAREVIAEARDLLGGNGILLDYHVIRHMADIEAHPHLRGHRDHPDPHRRKGHHRCRRLRLTRPATHRTSGPRRRRAVSVDVDRVRLRTSTRGSGSPLLIITGLGASLELAEPFEREMVTRGRRTISFDAPGVGESTGYRWPRRMPGVARTIERLLDALDYRQVDVIGVSLGGVIAQQLAHQAPDRVRRLVLVATGPGRRAGRHPRVTAGDARTGHPTPVHLTQYYRQHRRRPLRRAGPHRPRRPAARLHHPVRPNPKPGGYLGQLYAISFWTGIPWLRQLHQPTLVLTGDDDPIIPVLNGRILAHCIPNAQLHIIPGGGHLILLERPAETADLVANFLQITNRTIH